MSYCPNCGKELSEGSKFCQNCGKATDSNQANNNQPQYQPPYQQQYQQQTYQPPYQQQYQQQTYQPPYQQHYAPQKNIVQLLSKKVNVQAVIWLIIACTQYILGIFNIVYGVNEFYDEQITMGMCILVVAILNTVFSITNFKYSSEVLRNPVGIVSKYSPITGIIITLIYNVLFGGLIGIAGSIYAFVIRNFVVTHEIEFIKIEQQYNNFKNAARKQVQNDEKTNTEKIYDYIDDIPEWARETVSVLLEKGIVKSDDFGRLGLTEKDLMQLYENEKNGLYD